MERLGFASVMTVLRRNINEDLCPNQLELVETLFCDMGSSPESCMEFDNGLVCRWINGLAKLSPKITAHYQENRNQRKLACTIQNRILPMMPDSAMAVQELYDIHTLFSLYRLSKSEQEIMRCLIFIPSKGISARRFGSWLKLRNLNKVNDLIEMGFVQPGNNRYVSLHPMIREVAVEELKPSVQNCRTMLDSLQEISLLHGIEMPGHRQFFQMAENIIDLIRKDDVPTYLLFLENVFEYMEKYRYEPGMNAIISELEGMTSPVLQSIRKLLA